VTDSCTICTSPSRRPVRKLLDIPRTNLVPWPMHLTQFHY